MSSTSPGVLDALEAEILPLLDEEWEKADPIAKYWTKKTKKLSEQLYQCGRRADMVNP